MLLRMSSGLEFEEVYAPFKDATTMLYAQKSMADFAAAKPLETEPDTKWYYSSGTANIIARIIMDKTGGTLAAVQNFSRQRLFVSLRQACVKFPEGHDIIRSRTIWKGDAVSFDLAKQCNEWVKMYQDMGFGDTHIWQIRQCCQNRTCLIQKGEKV
jgi:hypothetical protein